MFQLSREEARVFEIPNWNGKAGRRPRWPALYSLRLYRARSGHTVFRKDLREGGGTSTRRGTTRPNVWACSLHMT